MIQEWLNSGKRAPGRSADVAVVEIIAAFFDHAEKHYRCADGTSTSEVKNFRDALRPLKRLYGRTPAQGFGPVALKAVRSDMMRLG